MTELIAELRAVELLAGLGDELLDRIAQVVTTETLNKGDTLVTEGTIGEDLYFVRQGAFQVTVRDGETQTEVARLGPGDVIGETQLIAGGRRTATVRAQDKCTVLRLPHADFDALVVASEPLREAVARVIRHRLRESALRVALPHGVGSEPELLDLLSSRAKWVRLERSKILWEQDETADGWYVLVSGELIVSVVDHGVRREVGTIRRGGVFGELALILGTARSATITAARDSWLAKFDNDILDDEILTRNDAMRSLVFSLANRLAARSGSAPNSGGVIALLPRDPDHDIADFIQLLLETLGPHSLLVDPDTLRREGVIGDSEHLPTDHPAWLRFEAWVESRRSDAGHVLLLASGRDDPWTRTVVDTADTVLLLVDADSNPARSDMERAVLDHPASEEASPLWLVLEHPEDRALPSATSTWLDAREVQHHAHVRRGHRRDIARLARWLTGRFTGIALSGGGARGFVHLGVVAAMLESGCELDLIAGTSAGAMAGGLLARDELPEILMVGGLEAIEANGNPFVEFDLPIISVLRSHRLREGLHQTYGEVEIEDSWIPLRIVATDLTDSRRRVFKRGLVWHHVFASSSPPGLMAPVKEGNSLLCDGGLVDNLPVSVLKEEGCEFKYASYVGSAPILPAPQRGFPTSWSLLIDKGLRRGRHQDVPTLATTLLQCVSVPAAAQLEDARKSADVFFQPDLSEFSVTDVDSAHEMFQAGLLHARSVLEKSRGGADDAE